MKASSVWGVSFCVGDGDWGGGGGLTVSGGAAGEEFCGEGLLGAGVVESGDAGFGGGAFFGGGVGGYQFLAAEGVVAADRRKEEGRLLRRLGRLLGLVALLDQVDVQQRLPAALGHEAERHHVLAELVDDGGGQGVVGFVVGGVRGEGGFQEALAAFARGGGRGGLGDLGLGDLARGDVLEEGAVRPELHAELALGRAGEVLACGREGEGGAGALEAEGVDEVAGGQVPDADGRVLRGGDDPAAVIGEAKVVDVAAAAPELADGLAGLDVDDADRVVVAGEGDEVVAGVVLAARDLGHGRPVEFVDEVACDKVPELDLSVEGARHDGVVEGVDDEARHGGCVSSGAGGEGCSVSRFQFIDIGQGLALLHLDLPELRGSQPGGESLAVPSGLHVVNIDAAPDRSDKSKGTALAEGDCRYVFTVTRLERPPSGFPPTPEPGASPRVVLVGRDDALPSRHAAQLGVRRPHFVVALVPYWLLPRHGAHATVPVERAGNACDFWCLELVEGGGWPVAKRGIGQDANLLCLFANIALT